VTDKEIKNRLSFRKPYAQWLKDNQITLKQLPEPVRVHASDHQTILNRQRAFGYTDEDLKMILEPMAGKGEELLARWEQILRWLVFQTATAPVQLLQAAFRAGYEPAD